MQISNELTFLALDFAPRSTDLNFERLLESGGNSTSCFYNIFFIYSTLFTIDFPKVTFEQENLS